MSTRPDAHTLSMATMTIINSDRLAAEEEEEDEYKQNTTYEIAIEISECTSKYKIPKIRLL